MLHKIKDIKICVSFCAQYIEIFSFFSKVVKHCVALRDCGREFQTSDLLPHSGSKHGKRSFFQRFQERNLELPAGRCLESAGSWRKSIDEEGQKYVAAYCFDRYTENRDRQFLYQILASGVL